MSWKNIEFSKITISTVQMCDFFSFSSAFIRFHEKILKFKSSFFSGFRCGIRRMFKRFHKISWKNIEIQKFTFFPVQMWDYTSSSAFIRFHEKILNFQNLLFSQFRFEIQCIFKRFHKISWKNIEISNFTLIPVQMLDSMHLQAFT